jgi:hypothetical protein
MCVEHSTASNTKIINTLAFIGHVSIIMLVSIMQDVLNKTEANGEICNI